jgi:hypothetical protein
MVFCGNKKSDREDSDSDAAYRFEAVPSTLILFVKYTFHGGLMIYESLKFII